MGNWRSSPGMVHLSAVAQDFCPFPDYSHDHLYNMLSPNSSQLLSEHYAAVQASLTPQQLQDFTRTMRTTFGKRGKVSYGGVGVVALSLAILFDTVAKQVKWEYVSEQEPIPGLFLKEPSGFYPPNVYIVSQYLRLVPYIANNPTRMKDEITKYVQKQIPLFTLNDVTFKNEMRCSVVKQHMLVYLKTVFNEEVELPAAPEIELTDQELGLIYKTNCDVKVASDRFMAELEASGNPATEVFKNWDRDMKTKTIIEHFLHLKLLTHIFSEHVSADVLPKRHFDLKANALGKWK